MSKHGMAVLMCGVLLSASAGVPALAGQQTAQAQSQCIVVKEKETQGELKVLHFHNVCKFPVWAIIKNRDTGQYSVHRLKPGGDHEDVGGKYFPEVAGWCKTGDSDCLREWGLK